MKKNINTKEIKLPTTSQLEKQLSREIYKCRYKKLLKSTIYTLIIVVSLSILATSYLFSVLQTYGDSMNPTITEGNIVVSIKDKKIEKGDVIAFYYNNRILIKRVIATSSEWIDIDKEGNVLINNKVINEPYIEEKSYGQPDIEFPYQVPENSYFVLGDKRDTSIDSRNSLIGTISEEEIIGKVIFKVWPLNNFRIIS